MSMAQDPMTTNPKLNTRQLAEMLATLVRGFTRFHKDLTMEATDYGPSLTMIRAQANRADHPRVVGSQGKHVMALQSLCRRIGELHGANVQFSLIEPVRGEKLPPEPFVLSPKWKPGTIVAMLESVLSWVLPGAKVKVREDAHTVLVVKSEPDTEIALALNLLFRAIGRNQGRVVDVVIENNGQAS